MTTSDSRLGRLGALGLSLFVFAAIACSDQAESSDAAPAAPAATASAPVGAAAIPTAAPRPSAAAATPPAGGAAPAAPAAEEPLLEASQLPEVVARIDGAAISRRDLVTRAGEARSALVERGFPQPPPTRRFFRGVLDDIIGNRLLNADLVASGRGATPAEIDEQVQALGAQFPSPEEFDKALNGRGFDRELLKRDLAEAIAVRKWVQGVVVPSITVTEAEVRKFYDDNPQRMMEPEKVHARHILIKVARDATAEQKEERRRRTEEIRARITGGADFATVAREVSEDAGSAAKGGELGWFPRGLMVPAFEQAAFAQQPKTLSGVVESPFGFHIVEVLDKRPPGKAAYDEVRGRVEALLKQRRLEETVRARINELAAKSKIEILL